MKNNKLKTSLVAGLLIVTNIYANELSTITVTSATKSEQSIKDTTSNIDVITNEELKERHFTTVVEALNTLPGISFTSNGGIGSTISLLLRGTSNNRTLILIDGIKYKDHSSLSGTDISTLMVNDIERIEVIKGAQSGIWGADAAAGVVNIITKSVKKGPNASIFIEKGSFGSTKTGAQLSYGEDKFEIKLDAQKVSSDSFSSRITKDKDLKYFEDDAYDNTTVNLKLNYFINDNAKLKFNIVDIDSYKEYDGFAGPDDDAMKNDSESRIYSMAYYQKYKDHNISLKLDKSNIKRDQVGTTWGVKLTNNDTKSIEIMDDFKYSDNDFIVFGINRSVETIDFTRADKTGGSATNSSKSIFATNSNKFENLTLTESIRVDSFENFDNKTTGKLGVRYDISNNFSILSNLGTSYSVPLLINNVNPWGHTNFNIKPEESKSFDVGFEYESFKFTYFYQKVKDLIDWYDPTPTNFFNNDAEYRNLDGKSRFKGFEISYKKDIFENTLLSLNYTRLKVEDKDGEYIRRRPTQNLKLGVDYYGIKDFHFNINGEYIGTRYNDDNKEGEQTGRYTVWNAVVNYDISKNLSSYLKVDNVFDKNYQISDGYSTAPRSAYVGLRYTF